DSERDSDPRTWIRSFCENILAAGDLAGLANTTASVRSVLAGVVHGSKRNLAAMAVRDCFEFYCAPKEKLTMNASPRINLVHTSAVLLTLASAATAADQPGIRAALYPEKARKPAAGFALQDATGKTVKIEDYRGKVVLLDFWATWCTGCKKEIPWFSEFQTKYGHAGFAVVGVSLDGDGWKVLKPFLDEHKVPYA